MRAFITIITTTLFYSISYSQNIDFTLANPQPNLINVEAGSFASGDIDDDGDLDLLVAGSNPVAATALYLNDGSGNFTEDSNVPFPIANNTVTIFKDLDEDGDLDLFFSGNGNGIGAFTHIYLNNGSGELTKKQNPSLPKFADGNATIGDVDKDGDLDIIISASDVSDNYFADIYLNDGTANFTAMGSTAFTAVKFSSLKLIDIENDGDLDVIISGIQQNKNASVALYINDGHGNFSMDTNSVFEQIIAQDIDSDDLDNDGDLDILMSGSDNNFVIPFTNLYLNNGNGLFTKLESTNLQQTFLGSNEITDLDNDGDQDIIITGSQMGGLPNILSIAYENVGNNQFVESDIFGGDYLTASVVGDFNGDDLTDVITQGHINGTKAYWNTTQVLSIENIQDTFLHRSLYPNPSNGNFFIQTHLNDHLNMKIYDINGKIMYSKKSMRGLTNFNLNLSNGLYFVYLTSKSIHQTQKLIISK